MIQTTLAIIKPDSVAAGNTGKILAHLEGEGFRICAARMLSLTRDQAAGFYAEHRGKEFFGPLLEFMISGPVLVAALEGEEAVTRLREVIGDTDPSKAAPGTVRALFAATKTRNAIHASDSTRSAERELAFFFSKDELGLGSRAQG